MNLDTIDTIYADITLEQLYRGGKQTFTFSLPHCSLCNGRGRICCILPCCNCHGVKTITKEFDITYNNVCYNINNIIDTPYGKMQIVFNILPCNEFIQYGKNLHHLCLITEDELKNGFTRDINVFDDIIRIHDHVNRSYDVRTYKGRGIDDGDLVITYIVKVT